MAEFLKRLLKFVLFLVPAFAVIFIIWGLFPKLRNTSNIRLNKEQFSQLRLQEFKRVKNIDILFIGPSLCYRGFDTRIFKKYGYNTHNLGTSRQTPMQTKYLLKQYLKSINPTLVIYVLDPFITSAGTGVESATDFISNQYLSDSLTLQMVKEQNDIKVYNTFAYCYLRDKLLPYSNESISYVNQKYITGGFVERPVTYYKHDKLPSIKYIFNSQQLNSLEEIVQFLGECKQKFLFVYPPITSGKYTSISNRNDFIKNIERFGDVYNFNGKVILDDSLHFYDDKHLNQHGVEIYNREFLKVLGTKINTIVRPPNTN